MKKLINLLQLMLGIDERTGALAKPAATGWVTLTADRHPQHSLVQEAKVLNTTATLSSAMPIAVTAPPQCAQPQNGDRLGLAEGSSANGIFEAQGQKQPHVRGPLHGDMINLRLLIIAADPTDPNYAAIVEALDYVGIPYDTLYTQTQRLEQNQLCQGSTAYYQGIIIATARGGQWRAEQAGWIDTLEPQEEAQIRVFCQRFGVRRLVCFCPPGTEVGAAPDDSASHLRLLTQYIDPGDPTGDPACKLALQLTTAGQSIFDYLRPDCAIPAGPLTAAFVPVETSAHSAASKPAGTPETGQAIPLLTTSDGLPCMVQIIYPEGDEELLTGVAHATDALHTLLLGYGLINWVTRGLFVGQRRVYLNIQVDDIFNTNQIWNPETESAAPGDTYRLTSEDIDVVIEWLARIRRHPLVESGFTLDFAFNGGGIDRNTSSDSLAENLIRHQDWFRWINHGYTHLNLNTAGLDECFSEIQQNHLAALTLGLDAYTTDAMVTSEISGLDNPRFLFAAKSLGIRYLVSDTSRPGWNNPSPNVGNRSRFQPEILVIPRHPTNLLYDVSTPQAWASRYNTIYRGYWGRDLDHAEILEREAETMLRYLLRFDMDPIMFHQANLRSYDGEHTLLTDLLERVIEKYAEYYLRAPIISLSMQEIGERMAMRALCNAANIRASLLVGNGLIVSADRAVTLSITGLHLEDASEFYAGQHHSTISLRAGETYRVPALNVVGFHMDT